ncbi:MAG: hypothetical protein LAO03_10780 [Acidobacteriia bacterium]|nr:hypothetical protein [Terriglobia bacterium]
MKIKLSTPVLFPQLPVGRRRYGNTPALRQLLCAMLVLAGLAAPAQDRNDGIAVLNGGRTTILLKAPSPVITPATPHAAGLVTIYSNLGVGGSTYNPIAGSGVLGRNVPGMPYPEWLASGFTPDADHTVTEIQVGVTYVQGPNTVILSLNEDAAGLPGKPLHSWIFSNLPTFGTCCTLQTAKVTGGIPITKGTHYWIVLRTTNNNQGTWDVWNDNFFERQRPFSNNLGSGWLQGGIQTQGAFGVFGQ